MLTAKEKLAWEKKMEKDNYWLDCDYSDGACISYENSKKHFKYSGLAAESKDFGFAVSHLVLGVEELLKGLILLCLDRYPHFIDSDSKEKIFSQHNFKHFNAKEFLTALTVDSIGGYFRDPLYHLNSRNVANKFQRTAVFISKNLSKGEIVDDEIDDLVKLMDKANYYKNRGFYVDYDSGWRIPEDIKEPLYIQYKTLADKLMNFIEPLFITPLDDERMEYFLDESNWRLL